MNHSIPPLRSLSIHSTTLFLALLLSPCLRAETILGGAVSFTPPFPMLDELPPARVPKPPPGAPDLPPAKFTVIRDWKAQFRTTDETNGYAEVTFMLMPVSARFPADSGPAAEIRTIQDMKNYLDAARKDLTNVLNHSITIGEAGGREAVISKTQMRSGPSTWYHSPPQLRAFTKPITWYQNTYMFWKPPTGSRKAWLLQISIQADNEVSLDKLAKSIEGMTLIDSEK